MAKRLVKVSDIRLNPDNPRIINDDKLQKLVTSVKEFPKMLEKRPIVVDETMMVLGGNMRLKACIDAGFTEVWIDSTDVSGGEWDWGLLTSHWSVDELEQWGLDLPEDWGQEPEVEEDEAPMVDDKNPPVSKQGEVYQLGRHRLMCGDATSFGDVSDLLNGVVADCAVTDPPYGIDVVKGGKVGADFGIAKKGNYSAVINDDTTNTAKQNYEIIKELSSKQVIWGGNYFTDFLPFSDGWIVWDKRGDSGIRNTFADGEMAWCSFHTPIRIYTQLWNGMIREGEHEQRVHPTQKPLKMLGSVVKDFTKPNESVLDCFGGSGSVLIACEATDRTCYMMELDPKYCDVIRKRYHKLATGSIEGWEEATKSTEQEKAHA